MSEQKLIAEFIVEVKREMADVAEAAMLRPELGSPSSMAKSAGIYQGLHRAVEIMDAILRDTFEKEKRA